MKEIMNLPLPKFNQHLYTADEVLELCEAARSVALEAAAKAIEVSIGYDTYTAMRLAAERIRNLK